MSYISLYRKYRPDTFDKMIGQDHIVRTLTNQIKSGSIGHAYLFTGTRGTGKTSCAKIFSRAVNCLNNVDGSPCGKCKVCVDLSSSDNMDILEIDAASNNGVDEIREIRDKVKYPPVSGKYKVYIVDEVHMLTSAAFNALLKTLEEPPAHIIFILATTEVHKLPQTVLSRCMRFDFRLVPTIEIEKLITDIMLEMNKPYEKEAISAIAAAGEGSVRDALSVADMCLSYRVGKLTYADVQDVIGASSPELIIDITDAILSSNLEKLFQRIDDSAKAGKNFTIISRDVSYLLRNLIYIKNSDKADKLLNLPADLYNKQKLLADKHTSVRILTALEALCRLEGTMRYSIQPRIAFETATARAAIIGNELNADNLARLKALEDEVKCIKSGVPEITKNIKEEKSVKIQVINKQQEVEVEQVKKPQEPKAVNAEEPIEIADDAVPWKEDKIEENNPFDNLVPLDEEVVFGAVKYINKGEEEACVIIGKVITELRKKNLFHLHGIFGYNDVKVWIKDNNFYIETADDNAYNQLTEPNNFKVISDEIYRAGGSSYQKIIIIEPKRDTDKNKGLEKIKELFDNDIIKITK